MPLPRRVGISIIDRDGNVVLDVTSTVRADGTVGLRKFGLRLFFGSGGHDDLADADELGASRLLPAKSYQIDRGRLEADLADILQERGVTIVDDCVVREIDMSSNGVGHKVAASVSQEPRELSCRC